MNNRLREARGGGFRQSRNKTASFTDLSLSENTTVIRWTQIVQYDREADRGHSPFAHRK